LADAEHSLDISDLERLATASYLVGKDSLSAELWTRVHNDCLRSGLAARAARAAFWVIMDLLDRGENAGANGWLARSRRLLDEGRLDCPERGLLLVQAARLHVRSGDPEAAHEAARRAVELGSRFGDADLQLFGRLVLGQVLARRGETARAQTLFDEVMVAASLGEASPLAVGVAYCAVLDSCHQIFDLARAREWTAALSRWCTGQPDLVLFRGQCLVHRAEIMRLTGDWSHAEEEAERACSWIAERAAQPGEGESIGPLSPFKYPLGAALYQLGEIHRVRGNLDEAANAYRQASRHGQSPEPGMALLQLAHGRLDVACAVVRRLLSERQPRFLRATVLAAATDVMIAAADHAAARQAATELVGIGDESGVPFFRALAGLALGSVLVAEGDAPAALPVLRSAWMAWQELDAPYEAARARVQLALACHQLGDDEASAMEMDAARRVFERLGARPDLTRLGEMMSSRTTRQGRLTRRELEVIGLIASGKTNRAIAHELHISERTVDRHVSNILTKLDLPSRTAAAAYAYRHHLV
jgi:DNA-binding NarL/FixJ family response regulator